MCTDYVISWVLKRLTSIMIDGITAAFLASVDQMITSAAHLYSGTVEGLVPAVLIDAILCNQIKTKDQRGDEIPQSRNWSEVRSRGLCAN